MHLSSTLSHLIAHRSRGYGIALAFLLMCAVPFAPLPVRAQTIVDISNLPLFSSRAAHPNVAVTMSVEFPSVGWAFRDPSASTYIRTKEYLGYFDQTKCYTYAGGPPGLFSPAGNADANHECNNLFSGNFMNWVSMSAIDEFRYAMTGGNRVVDTAATSGATVQRAFLPDGSVPGGGVPSFYAYAFNFPRHTLVNGTIDGSASSNLRAVVPNSVGSNSDTIYVTNCRTQVFFATTSTGNCDPITKKNPGPDNNRGQFDVRVQVCDATEGPVRIDLCKNYGTTLLPIYKPVGEAQRNASKMRFSAFGYLMDFNNSGFPIGGTETSYTVPSGCDDGTGWNRCRYGGVLRAPMKYLGDTQYDASLTPSINLKKEFLSNGTLIADPEGNAVSAGGAYSGFINYINKFGATGLYKRYDTMGEMYYEAIRYFQNLGPTPDAAMGSYNNTVKDHFPLTTTWIDPILSSCSANYIINLSDANTWTDTYLPGYSGSPAPNFRPSSRAVEGGLDAFAWTQKIGVLESTMSSLVPNDVRPGLSGLESQYTGAGIATYFAAGAAYWANTNDIRADLQGKQTIKTISFDVAEPSIQLQDRQLYLMGKYGGFNNTIDRVVDGTQQNPFWAADPGNPKGPAIRSNSEWEDSPGSGFPANYLLASDPQKLINGLRAAFAKINSATGTLSGASLTSANLTYGSAGAYTATFDPKKWSGSVLFNTLSVDPITGLLVVSAAPLWDSGALLTARCGTVVSLSTVCTDTDTSVNKRNIVTTIQVAGTRVATNFTYTNIALDPAYLLTLNTNPATGLPDLLGQQRVNYLRGYRADEASALGFRSRDSAMGDIVNSGPIFVGAPSSGISDASYQTFYATNSSRAPAVYVGANDGMLHAIRASTGVELFSYIPGFVARDLNDLTNPAYSHETFVDTVPKVQEALVNGVWKTVLVGASGNGAQGIFALDVTNPTAFTTANVLFEFSDADDADFGNVIASPEIAKLQVAANVYKYFAVVTGYNNKRTDVNNNVGGDTNVSTDTLNKGVLFLISLDHMLNTAWVQGTDYYKFTFPATNVASPNGLGPVTLLPSKSGDRSTAAMYFGDVQGNLWRFNTAGNSPSTWTPARGTVAVPLPIFIAKDAANKLQPITARIELAGGPFGSTLLFFGTGEYLGLTDLSLPGAQQSEYGLLDTQSSSVITRSTDLVQRNAAVIPDPITGKPVITVTGAAFSYSGTSAKKGWYVDFPSSVSVGERSVTKPAVRTGLLTFTTLTLANTLCDVGNGFIYQVNALTGLPYGSAPYIGYSSTVGIPGPPRIVDLTLSPGQLRGTGEQINNKTQATLVSGTLGKIDTPGPVIPAKAPPVGRINWREITNWNDLTGH